MKILTKNDEEEKSYDHEKELEKLKKDPEKYLKELNLDKEYIDAMRNVFEIKLTPGLDYIPAIYAGGETEFNLNIGRTAFRNGQPDFKMGLLSGYKKKIHKYLIEDPLSDHALDEVADKKEYFGDGEFSQGEKDHDYQIESE